MKIFHINSFFKKIAELQLKFRWPIIIITVILIIFGLAGLRYAEISVSSERWFNDSDKIEIITKKFEEQFGNNDNVGILVEADDVFDPEVLKAIKELGDELLDSVPYANEINSLVKMEISVGTEDGIEVINPFEEGIPEDPQKIEEIRNLILSRQALVNKIVTKDCTETWLTLSLQEYPKTDSKVNPMLQVGEAAVKVVTSPKWQNRKFTLKAAGAPYTEFEEKIFFRGENLTRVKFGFWVMIILLTLFLHSFRGVFVPLFTTIAGIVIVFGTMGWLDIGIDSGMMTLPILLGMALSVGYSIHMVNAFKRFFRTGIDRKEAIIAAVEETGWPIFFTAVTTIGSLLTFVAAGILAIDWLGFSCAAVVFVDYLLVVSLIPILMSFGKNRQSRFAAHAQKFSVMEKGLEMLGKLVTKRKNAILILYFISVLLVVPGIFSLTVNMDSFEYLGVKIPYVKRLQEIVDSQLGSYISYNITVDFDEQDAIKNPETLQKFDAFLDSIGDFELTKKNQNTASVFSILDIIKEMNQTLHSDSTEYHSIPGTQEQIAQELLLYEFSGGTKTFEWIDEDYSTMRAQVQLNKFDANEIVNELDIIQKEGKAYFPDAEINVIGGAVQFAELNKKIVTGELKSTICALIVIGILLILVFGSLKTGLIGMIPNITPIIFISGYMGHFHYTMDMMTMTIMPMLLGIAVDDTIHFINHIKYEFEKCGDYKYAVIKSTKTVGKTLAMTTILLCATFMVYMFSPVANLVRIGFLASMGLTAALITDFLVTPSLVILTHPFGKETKRKAIEEAQDAKENILVAFILHIKNHHKK